ncbi:uncharacterized protein LOC141620200 [Silene latifolia]|uniref:uncharacterized protein LOC141620200 n=1 Tax=Silene latifolia TaxID=37657 RepID=UPI003D77B082
MARKSNLQRQREMTMRGRSIHVTQEDYSSKTSEEEIETVVENSDELCPNTMHGKPNGEEGGKMKDVNELVGIPELVVETETEEEEVVKETQEVLITEEIDTETEDDDMLQIQSEDVEEEVVYWNQAVLCYILGANPPWEVIEGFIRRIWTKYNIDKISFMPSGVFLVRFKTVEMRDKVLQAGHFLFDNKPMIVKAWHKDLGMTKEDVQSVPAWIRLHNLPLKFWEKSLPKISSLVGKFVKNDQATEERTRLGFARVMVEMVVDQKLPEKVSFRDENGKIVQIDVEYEWRPVKCLKCQGMGHEMENCRRGEQKKEKAVVKQVWRPKQPVTMEKGDPPLTAENGKLQVAGTAAMSTPRSSIKRLTILRRKPVGEGYNNTEFGAHSYKDILSPSKDVGAQGNAQIDSLLDKKVFHLTMVYAFNGIQERAPLWVQLRRIAGQTQGPWAIAGEFNCVLSATERIGGNTTAAEMDPFRECLEDCEVVDIAATGSLYTWNNKQRPEERIYSRLDRFLINKEWSDHYPDLYAHFLPEGLFDHSPCMIGSTQRAQRKNNFKYFNMWGGSKDFKEIVRQIWHQQIRGTPMYSLVNKLKCLKPKLIQLNRDGFSDIE